MGLKMVLFLFDHAHKLLVFTHIVVFVVAVRVDNKAHGSRGEIVESSPDAGHYKQRLVGAIERETALVEAVVDHHFEAAGGCHQQFVTFFVRMATTVGAGGHIVDVVNASYVELHLLVVLHHGEVAVGMMNLGKLHHHAVGDSADAV